MLVAQWYSAQDALHEILGSISTRYAHSFFGFSEYVPVRTKYILVHTCESFEKEKLTFQFGTRYILICTANKYSYRPVQAVSCYT